MGIAGFYRQWIAKTFHKQWIDRLHLGQSRTYKFDTLLVDFNGIIHNCHEKVYNKMIEAGATEETIQRDKVLVINPKIRAKIAKRLDALITHSIAMLLNE